MIRNDLGRQPRRAWSAFISIRIRRLPPPVTLIVLAILAASTTQAGYVSVSTHNPLLRQSDSATYGEWYFVPGSAAWANISWLSGTNYIVGVAYGPTKFGPEAKFSPGPPLAGVTFTGFNQTDTPAPPFPPWVRTSGSGSSTTVPAVYGLVPCSATWTLHADYDEVIVGARCYGIAYGYDPWPIFPAAFAQDTLPNFDLYVPLGMLGGSAGGADSVGRFEYAVNYVTAQDTTHLLNVRVTDGYVQTTSPDNPPGVAFYMVGSQDTIPTTAPANLLNLDGIRSALQARMHGVGFTDSLVIGVFCPNLPIPTTAIRDSTLAEIEVNSSIELGTQGTISAVPDGTPSGAMWLEPPVPNPMGTAAAFRFTQARETLVSLSLYDVRGRLVRQIGGGEFAAGEHVVRWNGRDATGETVPAGVYFLRLSADGESLTRRLVVVR